MKRDWLFGSSGFRVTYVSRHWVGRPDPSGLGRCTQYFVTRAEADAYVKLLTEKGCRVISLEAR